MLLGQRVVQTERQVLGDGGDGKLGVMPEALVKGALVKQGRGGGRGLGPSPENTGKR